MKRNYEDAELNVTRFEYEDVMAEGPDRVSGGIPDEGEEFPGDM